jgi:hypothetical protein
VLVKNIKKNKFTSSENITFSNGSLSKNTKNEIILKKKFFKTCINLLYSNVKTSTNIFQTISHTKFAKRPRDSFFFSYLRTKKNKKNYNNFFKVFKGQNIFKTYQSTLSYGIGSYFYNFNELKEQRDNLFEIFPLNTGDQIDTEEAL